jgi:aryl carrier-like protein
MVSSIRVKENFGPKRDEATGEWRKLLIEELGNLYSSPTIIRLRKLRIVELGDLYSSPTIIRWRKLHIEELGDMYSSPTIIRWRKLQRWRTILYRVI